MANRDYYEILGVSRGASREEIKRAYKRLARKYHPDVAEDRAEAERRFGEINEAYAVLSDDEKRAYYDRFGRVPSEAGAGGDPFGGMGGFGGFPFSDLFESLFDLGMGGGARSRSRATRGDDLRVHLEITLEEAYRGAEREVRYTVEDRCGTCQGRRTTSSDGVERCRTCGGAGQVQRVVSTAFGRLAQVTPCPACRGEGQVLRNPCPECRGRGIAPRQRTVTVKIPPGIQEGQRLRIPEAGGGGTGGGPPGDLYVTFSIQEHPEFQRQGDDLKRTLQLKFTDAALGATVEVPLLSGESVPLKIPPGTQNGTTFRFRGKGMPHVGEAGRGDLLVEVAVMVPTRLNARQKKLLQEFAEAGSQEAESDPGVWGKIRDALFG